MANALQHSRNRIPGLVNTIFIVPTAQAVEIGSSPTHSSVVDDASLTFSHETFVGNDTVLVVGVSLSNNGQEVSSITYNGSSLIRMGYSVDGANTGRAELWYLVDPSHGVHDIVITTSDVTHIIAGAISFNNVNQSSPYSGITTNVNNDTITVPSQSGSKVVAMVSFWDNAGGVVSDIDQTDIWYDTSDGAWQGIESRKDGDTSVTLSWTLLTTYSAIVAASINN